MEINFTAFNKEKSYIMPKQALRDDSGYDLYTILDQSYVLKPGKVHLFDTNIAMQIPHGFEGQVRSRSGLALKNGIFVLNGIGTIDSSYRGSIGIILANFGEEDFEVINEMKIAQLVFNQICVADLQYVDDLLETQRGNKGFGSTGKY